MRGISQYSALGAALQKDAARQEDVLRDIGGMLRDAREAYEIDLREAAKAILVPVSHVEALESGDWSAMPGGEVYGRGYLKKYAEYLGFKREDIVERLSPPPPMAEPLKTPVLAPRPATINLKPFLFGIIIVVFAFGIGAVIATMPESDSTRSVKPVPEHLTHYLEYGEASVFHAPSCLDVSTPDNSLTCYLSVRLQEAKPLPSLLYVKEALPL